MKARDNGLATLKTIGVLAHPQRPRTVPVADRIAASLADHQIETWVHHEWTPREVADDVQRADVVVAIGGDGAMLRAARVCAPHGVPVLGLNMGRLGFLTEIATPDDWEEALERLLAGQYRIEERMMITAMIVRDRRVLTSDNALNEVVISGAAAGTLIQLDAYIDGNWTTTYNADALIISTPTGSTAYALAAGGPILPPDLRSILMIPAASHLSMDRPIVLSKGSQVAVRPSSINRSQPQVMLDGMRLALLEEEDILYIRASDFHSRFVRFRDETYFYRSLLDRLEPRVNRLAPQHMKTVPDIEETDG